MNNDVPSGNTGEIVRQYYEYLYNHYLVQLGQTYKIRPDLLLLVLFWVFILSVFFYAYTRWQRTTQSGEGLYPVESYNGYIQETNGPVGSFLTLFFIGMFVWLLLVTILDILNGQIY